jgi:hypothetical protein
MLSRSDPRRPLIVFRMAFAQLRRHMLSNHREDLEVSISHFTEAIVLPPHLWPRHSQIILGAFYFLANALLIRSEVAKQPEDAINATKYLLHLRDQRHETPGISRHQVTASLVDALSLQVELEAGNVMQNIREMAILSHELLALETSDVDPTQFIIPIYAVVRSNIRPRNPDQPLDELIEFLRAARKHRPDLLECRIAFAKSLCCRYFMTTVDDDYEEVASVLDESLTYPSAGNTQDEFVANARRYVRDLVTNLAMWRSATFPTPEYLEEAIYRTRTDFDSPFRDHSSFVWDPEAISETRFRYFGPTGVEESSGNPPIPRQLRYFS